MLCRSSMVIMIVGVGLLALLIKPIIFVLYGQEFLPATKIFYAIGPGFCFWPLGHFLSIHVAATGRAKVSFFTSLGTVAVAAVTCGLLIPKYGAIGAGLSVSVIYTVWTLLFLIVYIKITRTRFSEVLFLQHSDWEYGKRLIRNTAAKLIKKEN